MNARRWGLFALAALVLALAGCEGETGPMGPEGPRGLTGVQGPAGEDGQDGQNGENNIIAYGQVEGTVTPPIISRDGPDGVTCSCARFWTGHIDVTLEGSFPAEEGLVMVNATSGTTGDSLDDNIATANVTLWSATRIVFCVETRDVDSSSPLENADFVYVVMKL